MAIEEVELTAAETYDNYSSNDIVSEYGDEDDLWGADDIPLSSLNDPSFAVKFDANLGVGTYRVDKLSIEVFYEVPIGVVLGPVLPPWQDEELQAGCVGRYNGNKKFVVVGKNGLMRVSDDGKTWVDQESGVGDTLRGAAFTEQGVVAVGDNGAIVVSEDTVNWSLQVSSSRDSLVGVVYNFGGGNTVAVGTDGAIRTRGNKSSNWEVRR